MTDFSNKFPKELRPGEVKDIGPSTFHRVSSKPDITRKEVDFLRKWMSDNLEQPFSCQRAYTNYAFKNSGKISSQAYVFYIQSDMDLVIFKLRHGDFLE